MGPNLKVHSAKLQEDYTIPVDIVIKDEAA
jgi:hypothetical protein